MVPPHRQEGSQVLSQIYALTYGLILSISQVDVPVKVRSANPHVDTSSVLPGEESGVMVPAHLYLEGLWQGEGEGSQ